MKKTKTNIFSCSFTCDLKSVSVLSRINFNPQVITFLEDRCKCLYSFFLLCHGLCVVLMDSEEISSIDYSIFFLFFLLDNPKRIP